MAKRLDRAGRTRRERVVAARSKTASGDNSSARRTAAMPTRMRGAGIGSELAERVAWSMLAALAAVAGLGVALALASGIVPALCPDDDGTCTLGSMVLVGMAGYLVALLASCAIGGLGIWFWVAYLVGYAPLVIVASVGEWWWWAALVLLPAAAALASAPLGRDTLPRTQRLALATLAVAGSAAVVWWYGFAA